MYMVMFVSNDMGQAEDMLELWVQAGISGVTILESSGMQQAVHRGLRDDFGLFVSMRKIMDAEEVHHRTLFSIVTNDETLNKIVEVSTEKVGDWSQPDTGVLIVLPVVQAYGLNKEFYK